LDPKNADPRGLYLLLSKGPDSMYVPTASVVEALETLLLLLLDSIACATDDGDVGTKWELELVTLTEEEWLELPKWDGWGQ